VIVVAGHLSIDPAHRETALAAIAAGVAATREEPGNLDYRFSPDLDEPDRFNLIERWEDEAAVDAHMNSPHLAEFLAAIGPCVAGAPEIIRYDVSSSSKLF